MNKITSKGASALFDALRESNSKIRKINASGNPINDECMASLGEYILCSLEISDVWLGMTHITDKGVETLSEYLTGNDTVNRLLLANNLRISDASFPYLVEIAKTSTIGVISLSRTSMSEDNQQEIYRLLTIPIEQRETPIKSLSKSATKR